MCSIMGYCSEAADYEQFRKGFDKTLSRGPDDSRIVDTGKGLLGFHRLAIMGLQPEGMQPFYRGADCVVCNGELYGFRFADVTVRFQDYDLELDIKILLDTLQTDTPALPKELNDKLFFTILEDYDDVPTKAGKMKKMKADPHYNVVQVKYAYAITCHKAQGGQWKCVFVDKMLFGEEVMTRELMQWLYTAITRATEKLYFINFDERFFDGK